MEKLAALLFIRKKRGFDSALGPILIESNYDLYISWQELKAII